MVQLKYNLFIVIDSVTTAYRLMKACEQVKELNLGRTIKRDGLESISKFVHVTKERRLLKSCNEGYNVYLQTYLQYLQHH